MKIIGIIGPPFSGKGTQSKIIQNTYNLIHVSTGDKIRLEKNTGTPFGMRVKEFEERGDLVPDELIEELLEKIILETLQEKGIIIDGFPRTVNQVDSFLRILNNHNLKLELVINLLVDIPELLKRAKKREQTSERIDDSEEKHKKRIKLFEDQTLPAIEYLRKKISVADIKGTGDINKVTNEIINTINTIQL